MSHFFQFRILVLCVLLGTIEASYANPSLPIEQIQIVPGAVSEDPVVVVGTPKRKGVLCYSFLKSFSQKQTGIATRYFRHGCTQTSTFVMRAKDLGDKGIFGLQRSENGRYCTFKYGIGFGDVSSYDIYVFDFKAPKKTAIWKANSSAFLTFQNYFLSPDGRYLAYVEGGYYWGTTSSTSAKPPRLFVYDNITRRRMLVAAPSIVPSSITWSASNVLYFSLQEPKKLTFKPDLYTFNPKSKRLNFVFKDCYKPLISPDGKKVAFFGSENPKSAFSLRPDWQRRADYMALCVANLDGSSRVALNVEKGSYPAVIWSHTSLACYTLKEVKPSPSAELSIIRWDIVSKKREEILKVTAQDNEPTPRDESGPQFSILGVAAKHDELLLSVIENKGPDPDSPHSAKMKVTQTLRLLDLETKQDMTLAISARILTHSWQGD